MKEQLRILAGAHPNGPDALNAFKDCGVSSMIAKRPRASMLFVK
jgi:hypothetical protein